MVVGKKKPTGPRHILSQTSSGSFDESILYQLITSSPAEHVAGAMREAIFSNYENIHLVCPETGMTYLHLMADNYMKFTDPRALPAVYMLCYAGIDVSTQDKEYEETALHRLFRKPSSHKIVMVLLRYGVDTTLKNKQGLTAEQYLEYEQPPGYQETLHWFRKLAPGLHSFISEGDHALTLECVEKLLKGWCKVCIHSRGKTLNLLQVAQMRAKDALLAELFKKHYYTNEFVHATLAGLPDEMKRIYKEGKKRIDVDTLDHTYQLDMNNPVVPQPLVAAAWEQSNYDVIDQLLTFDADVCTSYSNQPETNKMKPLFYQTLLGTPSVTDVNIMLRILQEGDLRCKTEDSTTFLHESVKYSLPAPFVSKLFSLDVPLEERDERGYTARERALQANKMDLVQVMDDVVIQAAREGDVKRLESLVLQLYEINEVKTADGRTLMALAANRELPSKVIKFIQTIPETLAHMQNLWNCVYRNDMAQLKKYLNNKDWKKIIYSRNRCGRSILLLAILNRNKEMIRLILKKHHKLVEYFDNFMLTCLHYAYLMFGEDNEIAQLLQSAGASVDWCCTHGMSAYFYQKGIMDEESYNFTVNFLSTTSLFIFPDGEAFKEMFIQACVAGNLAQVRQMSDQMRPYGAIAVLGSPNLLFDVIDAGREEVVVFLLEEGFDASVTKQYETCDLCPMLECFHPSYTLLDRAKMNQLHSLCNYLVQKSIGSSGALMDVPVDHQAHTDMEVDPETGMNINASNNHDVSETTMNDLSSQFTESTKL